MASAVGCTELCYADMQLRAQALSLRSNPSLWTIHSSTECMVGITPPRKPHFRLLQPAPDLKVMLVHCQEVTHNPARSCNSLNVVSVVHHGAIMHCVSW